MTPVSGSGEGGHSGDYGHVTPVSGSGEGVTLETGNVTRGKSSGEVGSPWRMWKRDPRCRVWERQVPWKLEM